MANIDILLPVKNGVAFLAESIDSVVAQTESDWRLLVLDHGSTDGSCEMAQRYSERDPRIQVHSLPQAQGLSGLLNMGLDLADCNYVLRHDADDICVPDRFALQLAGFRQQPECIAMGGHAELMDAAGTTTGMQSMPLGRHRVSAASLFRNPVIHPTAMLEFAAVQRMGVRYGQDFLGLVPDAERLEVPNLAEDYFLFGQLAVLGQVDNIPHRLLRYRWHTNNVSKTRFDDQMAVSLNVSRYLARSFSLQHGVPYVDPAPFCNHGARFFDVEGRRNFEREFGQLAANLRQVLGATPDLERELAFRRIPAVRGELGMLWRYLSFRQRHAPETDEWLSVRGWLLRHLPRRASVRVQAQAPSLA